MSHTPDAFSQQGDQMEVILFGASNKDVTAGLHNSTQGSWIKTQNAWAESEYLLQLLEMELL